MRLVFSMMALFLLVSLQAQVKYGPKVGMNISGMTIKAPAMNFATKFLYGFHGGFNVEILLQNEFYLQPGLQLSTKGANFTVEGTKNWLAPTFIELPINVMYKLDMGDAKLLLFAGPYMALGIGGTRSEGDVALDIRYGKGDMKDMRAFDAGLNLGVGVEMMSIQFSVQIEQGILNLAPVSGTTIRSYGIGVSLAYIFGEN